MDEKELLEKIAEMMPNREYRGSYFRNAAKEILRFVREHDREHGECSTAGVNLSTVAEWLYKYQGGKTPFCELPMGAGHQYFDGAKKVLAIIDGSRGEQEGTETWWVPVYRSDNVPVSIGVACASKDEADRLGNPSEDYIGAFPIHIPEPPLTAREKLEADTQEHLEHCASFVESRNLLRRWLELGEGKDG